MEDVKNVFEIGTNIVILNPGNATAIRVVNSSEQDIHNGVLNSNIHLSLDRATLIDGYFYFWEGPYLVVINTKVSSWPIVFNGMANQYMDIKEVKTITGILNRVYFYGPVNVVQGTYRFAYGFFYINTTTWVCSQLIAL